MHTYNSALLVALERPLSPIPIHRVHFMCVCVCWRAAQYSMCFVQNHPRCHVSIKRWAVKFSNTFCPNATTTTTTTTMPTCVRVHVSHAHMHLRDAHTEHCTHGYYRKPPTAADRLKCLCLRVYVVHVGCVCVFCAMCDETSCPNTHIHAPVYTIMNAAACTQPFYVCAVCI